MESATLEAARSRSTRGSGWLPSGPASPSWSAELPRAIRRGLRRRRRRAGRRLTVPAYVGLGAPYPPSCAVIDGCPLKSFFMEPASRALNISHVDSDGVCRGWLTWQLIPVHAKRVVIVAELPQRFAYGVRHDLRRIA